MAVILHIESSTLTCSAAVSNDGTLLALKESQDQAYSHSENLVVFMDQAIKDAGMKPNQIDAVCVSKGPGSYTGLRIGVSAAKGFCYSLGIPLLSVGSLQSMANMAMIDHASELNGITFLCPMIDARRMEVYTQVFDGELNAIQAVSAKIIDKESFASELNHGKVVFFGDGASKCKELIHHPNAIFLDDLNPSAKGMIAMAEQMFENAEFEDLAYFEPYYLKDFVAGMPKKMF